MRKSWIPCSNSAGNWNKKGEEEYRQILHVRYGSVLAWMLFPTQEMAGVTGLAVEYKAENISMDSIHTAFFMGMTVKTGEVFIAGRYMAFSTV